MDAKGNVPGCSARFSADFSPANYFAYCLNMDDYKLQTDQLCQVASD